MHTLLSPILTTVAEIEAVTLTKLEAEKFTSLSAKTLERCAAAGEPVGRIKIGRRVVFLRAALQAWLSSKAASVKTQNPIH